MTKTITDYAYCTEMSVPHEQAVGEVVAALKEEGFGVLTEIDVQATLKKKLDVDFRKYSILGACTPPLLIRLYRKNSISAYCCRATSLYTNRMVEV